MTDFQETGAVRPDHKAGLEPGRARSAARCPHDGPDHPVGDYCAMCEIEGYAEDARRKLTAAYSFEKRAWEPQCPYGDVCSGCDPRGYCTRMEGEDGRLGRRIAAINEGLSADDKRAINEGIERRLRGGFPGLGCVSPAEGTPQVGTEEGCG